ncbi:unnamed protein product [Cuscuta campestris]|uniref:HAT C-terminal dimerisation domain-containing protein n=1 Tax=Cuscuta campestris TaxID=132261 RepID=A0A484MQT4_9ASTE|nr:unnamed protein product [Cuscuta campestris]
MRAFLKSQGGGVWRTVETGWTEPVKYSEDLTTSTIKKFEDYSRTEVIAAENNDKALNAIFGAVDATQYRLISNCISAKEAWEILEVTHEESDDLIEQHMDLQEKWTELLMVNRRNIAEKNQLKLDLKVLKKNLEKAETDNADLKFELQKLKDYIKWMKITGAEVLDAQELMVKAPGDRKGIGCDSNTKTNNPPREDSMKIDKNVRSNHHPAHRSEQEEAGPEEQTNNEEDQTTGSEESAGTPEGSTEGGDTERRNNTGPTRWSLRRARSLHHTENPPEEKTEVQESKKKKKKKKPQSESKKRKESEACSSPKPPVKRTKPSPDAPSSSRQGRETRSSKSSQPSCTPGKQSVKLFPSILAKSYFYDVVKKSIIPQRNEEEEIIPPLLQVDARHLEGSHFNDMAAAAAPQNPASVDYQLSFLEKEIKSLQMDADYHNEIAQRSTERMNVLIQIAHTLRQTRSAQITQDLSQALQRREQDLLNALKLVQVVKWRFQSMRTDDMWNKISNEVMEFCYKNNIFVPNMNDRYVKQNKRARNAPVVTILHHYKFDCLFEIIDRFVEELGSRMADFYPREFSEVDIKILENQLENYILDVRTDSRFAALNGLVDLSMKMGSTKKDMTYQHVYTLIRLALLLPVATASVERAFSAMKFVKNELRNKICDQWLNDCLVTYIERNVFATISNDKIINHFQNMKTRRYHLPENKVKKGERRREGRSRWGDVRTGKKGKGEN